MALPLIICAFLSFIPAISQKFDKIFILFLLYLLFWGGFQYGMSDYIGYEYHYLNIQNSEFGFPRFSLHGASSQEFIYSSISLLFSNLGFPFHVFFIFIVALNIGVKILFIKKYSYIFLFSLLIYFFFYFGKDIMQLRASACLSIFLISLNSIINRSLKTFLILIFLASGFHIIALACLPIYYLYSKKIINCILPLLLFYCIFVVALGFNPLDFISEKLFSYKLGPVINDIAVRAESVSQNSTQDIKFGLGVLFLLVNGFLLFPIFSKMNKIEKLVSIIYVYGLSISFTFMGAPLLFYRLLELFVTFFFSVVVMFIFKYYKISLFQLTYIIVVFIYASYLFINGVISQQMPEYRNILFET
jgi:hypothetical protein